MMCDYCCKHMAARSRKQLDTRKENMAAAQHVAVGPCPSCGGTEWATTDVMIPPAEVSPMIERVMKKFHDALMARRRR